MTEVVAPNWDDLTTLVRGARDRLTVAFPFYTEQGVTRILDNLSETTFVSVKTKLSPSDWASGVADPEALHALLDLLPGRHDLSIVQRLHAKAYVADRLEALVGSSNLTDGGFGRNVELMVRMRGEEASAALDALLAATSAGKALAVSDLAAWIEESRPQILEARRAAKDVAAELAPAQAGLDRLLGYGATTRPLPALPGTRFDDFMAWLRRHAELAGATTIIRRHDNPDGQNLQGHVKQSFFVVYQFLTEHPELAPSLRMDLARLGPDDIYPVDEAVGNLWVEHLDEHATEHGDGWSYPILRGIMPPALGGTRQGGGGGSGTLKRMLTLVAQFLDDERR
jgi:hypothetical protein